MPVREAYAPRDLALGRHSSQLPAGAESKHFASCQFSIACKRIQGVTMPRRWHWEMGNGKMAKTFPRRIRFRTRIRFRIRFHFNFTFRLLSFWIYIWFDCRPRTPTPLLLFPPRLVSWFVYFQLQPRFYARQGKRHTNIYVKMAKTMRMPRPNSTAHLQMNRLMSAGCGVRATPTTPLSIPPCSFLSLFMRQSSGSAQIDFKHVNLNLLSPRC